MASWSEDQAKLVLRSGASPKGGQAARRKAAPRGAKVSLRLSGGLTLDQLAAEDNTSCLSQLSSIRLRTTFTVPEGGEAIHLG